MIYPDLAACDGETWCFGWIHLNSLVSGVVLRQAKPSLWGPTLGHTTGGPEKGPKRGRAETGTSQWNMELSGNIYILFVRMCSQIMFMFGRVICHKIMLYIVSCRYTYLDLHWIPCICKHSRPTRRSLTYWSLTLGPVSIASCHVGYDSIYTIQSIHIQLSESESRSDCIGWNFESTDISIKWFQ